MKFGKQGASADRAEARARYQREALDRKRADRWRLHVGRALPESWTGEAIWAASVWANSPFLQVYFDLPSGRHCLGGGGGPNGDEACAMAWACVRAADGVPQPGQVEVLAAVTAKVGPADLIAYARAAEQGVHTATNLATGKYVGPKAKILAKRKTMLRFDHCDFCGGLYEEAPRNHCSMKSEHDSIAVGGAS